MVDVLGIASYPAATEPSTLDGFQTEFSCSLFQLRYDVSST